MPAWVTWYSHKSVLQKLVISVLLLKFTKDTKDKSLFHQSLNSTDITA